MSILFLVMIHVVVYSWASLYQISPELMIYLMSLLTVRLPEHNWNQPTVWLQDCQMISSAVHSQRFFIVSWLHSDYCSVYMYMYWGGCLTVFVIVR